MLTLHITETEHAVTIPRDEFLKLIDRFQTIEPIKIIEDEDPDYLTAEEIKIRAETMEELEAGETISAEAYAAKRRCKGLDDVSN